MPPPLPPEPASYVPAPVSAPTSYHHQPGPLPQYPTPGVPYQLPPGTAYPAVHGFPAPLGGAPKYEVSPAAAAGYDAAAGYFTQQPPHPNKEDEEFVQFAKAWLSERYGGSTVWLDTKPYSMVFWSLIPNTDADPGSFRNCTD